MASTIETKINRISDNIAATYAAVAEKGGTVPEAANSDNLPEAVRSIPVSGGGSAINFSITAHETAPSESDIGSTNQIWVVSNNKTDYWAISKKNPTANLFGTDTIPVGAIWIFDYEDNLFNGLKDPGKSISIYPSKCFVYDGSTWNNKSAFIWQNSSWVQFSFDWEGELYMSGNPYESVTGGWTANGYSEFMAGVLSSDKMILEGTNSYMVGFGTVNKIDLSNHSRLHFVGNVTGTSGGPGKYGICVQYAGVVSMKAQGTVLANCATPMNVTDGDPFDISCDISNCDNGFVRAMVGRSYLCKAELTGIYLEV